MVNFIALSAIFAAQLAFAAPSVKRADSAIGQEVAVSAPDGIPITDTKELASQSAEEAASRAANADLTATAAYPAYTTSNAYDTAKAYDTAVVYDTAAVYDTSSAVWDETSSSYVYETTSAEYETTATYETAVYETSSAVYETSSAVYETSSAEYETTTAAYTATYGSGSVSWDNNGGYNDCVQQCIASFGAPPAAYTPPSETVSEVGSKGTGATHTVIVAPTQGVLRYVPFATNASVGDTIKFIWNANMHTVSKSSQLELCNKTLDQPFTSGVQNKSFVFTEVVNTTEPTYIYCSVGTHCQQGMFGIINPPSADVATSAASAIPAMANNDSQVAAWNAYVQNATKDSSKAASWGNSIDMGSLPEWAHQSTAENILYTRTFLAANPDVFQEDGSIDLSGDAPYAVPQDLNAALAATNSDASASGPSATGTDGSSTSAPVSSPSAASGARGLTVSITLASVVALGATLLAL